MTSSPPTAQAASLRSRAAQWLDSHRTMIMNAASMLGSTGVTSGLGFVYWWLAAHYFSPAEVGFASTSISTMMLLGEFSLVGLGTLLIAQLPRRPGEAASLIVTSVLVASLIGLLVGAGFALGAPFISADLADLAGSAANVVWFGVGVALTAAGLLADQAAIGLLRGQVQLSRNVIFSVGKLVFLFAVGVMAVGAGGMSLYGTWIAGILASLVGIAGYRALAGLDLRALRPDWRHLRLLGRSAVEHHVLNLMLLGPNLALPLLVTAIISAETAGNFFIAWTISGITFVGTNALVTVLYAAGTTNPERLVEQTRFSLRFSLLSVLLIALFLVVAGRFVLSLFGESYSGQALWPLWIMAFTSLPTVIRFHYVTLERIHGRIARTALIMMLSGLFRLALAALGGLTYGIIGLTVGLLVAACVEAVLMVPAIHATIAGHDERGG